MTDILTSRLLEPDTGGQAWGERGYGPLNQVSRDIEPDTGGQAWGCFVYRAITFVNSPNNFTPEYLTLLSTQESYLKLTLTFSAALNGLQAPYDSPLSWVFTGGGTPITATGVSLSGATITVHHTEPTNAAGYALTIPSAAIVTTGREKTIPSSASFNGVGQRPIAFSASAVDATHVEVQFSEAVNSVDATTIGNYSIAMSNSPFTVLPIISVSQLSSSKYRIETGTQTSFVVYSVGIQNIKDLADNPIFSPASIPVEFWGFGGLPGPLPPVVSNVLPTPSTSIPYTQPLSFDVTDDDGLSQIVVVISAPAYGLQEVAHNGTAFGIRYSNGTNARTTIPGGYSYVIYRDGGWPGNISLTVYAVDTAGQEV